MTGKSSNMIHVRRETMRKIIKLQAKKMIKLNRRVTQNEIVEDLLVTANKEKR